MCVFKVSHQLHPEGGGKKSLENKSYPAIFCQLWVSEWAELTGCMLGCHLVFLVRNHV